MASVAALMMGGRQTLGAAEPGIDRDLLGRGRDRQPGGDALRQALTAALRGKTWAGSDAVILEIPQSAENGAIVPVTVQSRLPNTDRILIFAEKNPNPLLAQFRFEPGTDAWVSLRLKLNDTGPVLAIAESEGAFFGTQKWVRVMVGGCG